MLHINARGVSEALHSGLQAIDSCGVTVETRNGDALEFPYPVCTEYTHPRERVLFYPERDANPFFHMLESLWMLDGRNDVQWISEYNGRINTYSDDGITFHGAYGYRWKKHWFDQLEIIIHRLKTYNNDRRCVLSMWDPVTDLVVTNDGKDYPCNTQIYFSARKVFDSELKSLDMTVVNRSNDLVWGAYGANAVHMSYLQEYVAQMCGFGVGKYYQFSNNLHVYMDVFEKVKPIITDADYEPYLTLAEDGLSYSSPFLINDTKTFNRELHTWMLMDETEWIAEDQRDKAERFKNKYLIKTASPIRFAWRCWKQKLLDEALAVADCIEDRAWRLACLEWLERRKK